jgi:hypothetical protein
MQSIFIKKCFLFLVESVCNVKWFTTGLRNSLKDVQKSQMMRDQVALFETVTEATVQRVEEFIQIHRTMTVWQLH